MYIRLKGLAKPSNGGNESHLIKLTGYAFVRDGDDWLIPEDDPVLIQGPKDILRTSETPWEILKGNHLKIGQDFAKEFLFQEFEETLEQPKEKITIYGDLGFKTILEQHALNFFLTPPNLLPKRLAEETIPYLVNEFHVDAVAPVVADARTQQFFISLCKILASVQFNGVDATAKRIGTDRELHAALPSSLDVLAYMESLNTMSPCAISIPMRRMGSSLHFLRPKPWFFPRLAIENIFEQLLSKVDPIADKELAFFTKDQLIQTRGIRTYFLVSVQSINQLCRYLNDLRTYVDKRGNFDCMKMAKAQSIVRLLFADWQAVNFTNSRYQKLRMVMSFLDKLSNFIKFMRADSRSETEIFKSLCSEKIVRLLEEQYRISFGRQYHALGRLMSGIATATYKKVHAHVSGQLGRENCSEEERLLYIRTIRNSAHGAFLNANQFESIFLAAGGRMCMEFTFLPLLLLWGLVSDPERFIQNA